MSAALVALGVAIVVGALVAVATTRYQHGQIFKPTRVHGKLSPDPASRGVAFDDVEFSGPDGSPLHGWWLPCSNDASTLLFCHGNRGNLSDRVSSCVFYRQLGLNVFALDYRGYGRSAGRPSEAGLYADALAAWRYLRDERRIDAQDIVVLGRSLGGGVVSHLATQTRPAAVVIEATFTSIADLAREQYPHLPQWGLPRVRFDNLARVGHIESPLMLVHSVDDQIIGFDHGKTLSEHAPAGHRFVPISGAHSGGHLTSGEAYAQPLREFLLDVGLRLKNDASTQGVQRSV